MKHQMIINVTDPIGRKREVLKGGEIRLCNRLLSVLFRRNNRVLVLAPADCVESVAIKEIKREGDEK